MVALATLCTHPPLSERLALPVLDGETEQDYTKEAAERPEVIWNCGTDRQDQPLKFYDYQNREKTNSAEGAMAESGHNEPDKVSLNPASLHLNPLGLDYDSSSSDDG